MDKPISAGDLVQVVRQKDCGCDDSVGYIFRVAFVEASIRAGRCFTCGLVTFDTGTRVAFRDDHAGAETYRLKRIPPLDELEGIKTQEPTREDEYA